MTSEGTRERGRKGEAVAAEHLRRIGYRIVDTNYRCRLGEVDIVAEEDGELVFVEVRSRVSGTGGVPEESIDRHKRERLRRLAESYLQSHPERAFHCRVDVVAVEFSPSGVPQRIELIKNAVTW